MSQASIQQDAMVRHLEEFSGEGVRPRSDDGSPERTTKRRGAPRLTSTTKNKAPKQTHLAANTSDELLRAMADDNDIVAGSAPSTALPPPSLAT